MQFHDTTLGRLGGKDPIRSTGVRLKPTGWQLNVPARAMPVEGNGWILRETKDVQSFDTCGRKEKQAKQTRNLQSLFINGPGFSASGNPEERMVLDCSFISVKRKPQKNTSTGSQSRENSRDPMDLPLIPPAD